MARSLVCQERGPLRDLSRLRIHDVLGLETKITDFRPLIEAWRPIRIAPEWRGIMTRPTCRLFWTASPDSRPTRGVRPRRPVIGLMVSPGTLTEDNGHDHEGQIARHKLSLLGLARELAAVSRACKVMVYPRQQFHGIRRNSQTCGAEGLTGRLRDRCLTSICCSRASRRRAARLKTGGSTTTRTGPIRGPEGSPQTSNMVQAGPYHEQNPS